MDIDSQNITDHIELCPIEARYSISLYTTSLSIWFSGFRDFFVQITLFEKANVPAREGASLG